MCVRVCAPIDLIISDQTCILILMHFILNICGSAAIENGLGLIFILPMLFVFECNVVLGSGVLVNSVEKTS